MGDVAISMEPTCVRPVTVVPQGMRRMSVRGGETQTAGEMSHHSPGQDSVKKPKLVRYQEIGT